MKRKLKQWRSRILITPLVSSNFSLTIPTRQWATTIHFNQLNAKHFDIYDVGNPASGLRHAQTCDGIESVNGIPTLYL